MFHRRKGLFIIDLENPYEPPRVLHHLTKWEVADVQWNPHFSRENWIASTVGTGNTCYQRYRWISVIETRPFLHSRTKRP
jgi:hypothetical protein